jgi:hypothetical protein
MADQWDTGVRASSAVPATGDIHSRGRVAGRRILGRIGYLGVRSLGRDFAARGCVVRGRAARLASVANHQPVSPTAEANGQDGKRPKDRSHRVAPLTTAHDTAIVHRQHATIARESPTCYPGSARSMEDS